MSELFGEATKKVSEAVLSPLAFVAAAGTVVLWVISGPFFPTATTQFIWGVRS